MKEVNVGNITTAENVGSGTGIFACKNNGNNLQFKTISSTGTSIQIINTATQIYISGASTSSGGINTANNGLTKFGDNVVLGGVLTGNTTFDGTGSNYHLKYTGDYSSNYTARSIPDAAWVTGQTSGGGGIGWSNLANGSTIAGCGTVASGSTICRNTVYGVNALKNVTTGDNNIAIGYLVLSANTTGIGNIGIGCSTLYNNINGVENIAYGTESLYNNISGQYNIGIGYVTLWCNTTGCENLAIGQSALNGNVSGCYNIALGCAALLVNSTGNDNISLGKRTLYNNDTGIMNIAIGENSLFSNLSGSYNVAISECALYCNKTGLNNIAIGDFAMFYNTGGTCNIGIGLEALYSNTCGNGNISIGADNLNNLTTGCDNIALGNLSANCLIGGCNNIFIGKYVGHNETGSYKLHIGSNSSSVNSKSLIYGEFDNEKLCVRGQTYISGLTNSVKTNVIYYDISTKELSYGLASGGTSGTTYVCVDVQNNIFTCINIPTGTTSASDNIGFGYQTLRKITSGSGNFANGCQSLFSNLSGSDNFANGFQSLYSNTSGSDNTVIGNSGLFYNTTGYDNIGIGNSILYNNTIGYGNIAFNYGALFCNTSGYDNIGIGRAAGQCNLTGNSNVFIGYSAGYNETGSNKLHIGSVIDKSLIYGEFDNEKLCIRGQTYMSGLTNSCSSNLIYYNNSTKELTYGVSCYLPLTGGTVSGCITAVNFILSSDCRLKENIRPITISEIDRVNMIEFNYISDETKHLRYGVVAQDLEKIHPEMVYENKEGFKEVAYIDFLVAKINSLEKRIGMLELKLI